MPVLGYVWHGFHDQYGIPNRFAFLYIFALLAMAYEGYCVLVRGKRKVSLWIYFAVILCGILIGITMKNVDSEIGNENGLRNSCSDRSYMVCFALYQKRFSGRKNIYDIDLFLIYSRNRSDGSDGISGNGTVDTDSYFQDTKAITEVKKSIRKM